MAEEEKIMYQILGALSVTDAPFVFKGALITKLVLSEGGFDLAERQTKDIDAQWLEKSPSMKSLVDTINNALTVFDGEFFAVATREYTETKTAGVSIIRTATGAEAVSMDIGIRPVAGSRIYYYGEIGIRGVLPTEILADKISVLSGRLIFRRAKDLFDVYALAHCVSVTTSDIYAIQKLKRQVIGEFTEFITRQDDVRHAYAKLRGISSKPDFDEIYAYLKAYLLPFMNKDLSSKLWNTDTSNWDEVD